MNTDPMKVRLEAVLFETSNPESLAEFYKQAFGLEEPKYYGTDHLGIDLQDIYLGFDRVSRPGEAGSSRVQLWFNVGDVEAGFKRLVDLGAKVKYSPERESSPGEVLALVFDPDGNQVGLIGNAEDGEK